LRASIARADAKQIVNPAFAPPEESWEF